MLFGHNTNLTLDGVTYHVQTEDRGAESALIDTTVFCGGRVMHRRTNNYFDLLPLDDDSQQALKLRLDEQHRMVLEEIRSRTLHFAVTPAPAKKQLVSAPANVVAAANAKPPVAPHVPLLLELINAKTWLTGRRALLQISVRAQNGKGVEYAKVTATIEGAAESCVFSTETGSFGHAQFEFDMPKLAAPECALVIDAEKDDARGQLRYQLRAKPKVPSAG